MRWPTQKGSRSTTEGRMRSELYADTINDLPLLAVEPETLSDGSIVWNLEWRELVIPCISEDHARKAFARIAEALKGATNENIDASC